MSARSDSPVLLCGVDGSAPACRAVETAGHPGPEAVVRAGPVARTLISVAHETGADTIVLGRHGHSALRRTVLGSVSQELADRSGRTLVLVS